MLQNVYVCMHVCIYMCVRVRRLQGFETHVRLHMQSLKAGARESDAIAKVAMLVSSCLPKSPYTPHVKDI